MGNPRAFRGPGISTVDLCDFISVCFPRVAVERRQFSDSLGDSHAKLGRSRLKHVRGVRVDLDVDVGAHETRIPDSDGPGVHGLETYEVRRPLRRPSARSGVRNQDWSRRCSRRFVRDRRPRPWSSGRASAAIALIRASRVAVLVTEGHGAQDEKIERPLKKGDPLAVVLDRHATRVCAPIWVGYQPEWHRLSGTDLSPRFIPIFDLISCRGRAGWSSTL